ncbi:hypothetical protein [Mycoplasmopsis cynos]|nr:hypothetical protein [Mycoplasmopsis cynos]UWV92419.1 hypothetical protein NWE57_06210 [Mycoplasmopsis cynos]
MPFDQEVAKRIDVKIYEIGSILANIDSTNCVAILLMMILNSIMMKF